MAGFLVVTGRSRDWGAGYRAGGWAGLQEGELGTRLGLCPHWKRHPLALVRSLQHPLCPECLWGCNCEGPPLSPFCLRQLGLWPGWVELAWDQHLQGSGVLTKGW